MGPGKYTEAYANMWTWIVGDGGEPEYAGAPIRNYLQNNLESKATKEQAQRAQNAYSDLSRAIQQRLGRAPGATFTIGEDTYVLLSLQRVYWGKGAPSEIQDALWLATLLGVVKPGNVNRYCRECLGVDCGGFVASYWGFGKPSFSDLKPAGWAGMLPRDFWAEAGHRRRARPEQIQTGDAVIFFEGKVVGNDPSTRAPKRADGSYDTTQGTKAFHIGLVDSASVVNDKVTTLSVAESSGAASQYSGNGVNVRNVNIQSTTIAGGLVGCTVSSSERLYFVGPRGGRIAPYQSQFGD
jgi:hypothetical protein